MRHRKLRPTRARLAASALLTLATVVVGTAPDAEADGTQVGQPDAVITWNEVANDAMVRLLIDPLHESRLYAMTHLAIHDALNAIERHSEPYALDVGPFPGASTDAAVATAARDVLVRGLKQLPVDYPTSEIDLSVNLVDDAYDEALAAVPDGSAKSQGVDLGRASAAVINAMRIDDGSGKPLLDYDYPQTNEPGQFRFVKGFPFAFAPDWGDVSPFVMRSGDQFRPRPPHPLRSRKYADDFNELKELGDIKSKTRTDEQTEIAFFWFESSPQRWNRIARTVSLDAGLDLWANARLFGLLNIVSADGYISNWESKRHYNRWRPETAVHFADIDGNPRTLADPTWVPLWGSSGAGPEYDSGHTIEGAGMAAVLAELIGTDAVSFSACSYTFQNAAWNCDGTSPIYRQYDSFSAAAWENGLSRIWVGWHFRNAVEVGYRHGERLGQYAINRFLVPVA